jgi:hypothetical protein
MDAQMKAQIPTVKDKKEMIVSQNIGRTFAYVHCWYEGSSHDAKMWQSEYGHSGRAVCISTTTKALQEAVGDGPNHLCCQVARCTYRDETETIPELFSSAPALRKLRKFAWENEIRMLAEIKMGHHAKDENGYLLEAPAFQMLSIDLAQLVKELVLGPNLSPDEVGEIFAAVSPMIPASKVRPLKY